MPKLTQQLIENTPPGNRPIELRDETLRGFHVRIYPGGAATYYLSYRTRARKERRLKVARVDEMSPKKAREIARTFLEVVRKGGDPAAERKAARQEAKAARAAGVTMRDVSRCTNPERHCACLDDLHKRLARIETILTP